MSAVTGRAQLIDFSPEVEKALKTTPRLLVALESTIISHGMPYPQNLETARQVEAVVRENGAVPATIAIIDGRIKVGLSDAQLDFLASAKSVLKASTRDVPYIVSRKLSGATTVAATSLIASWAGIRLFATGGIGGVHRDYPETMDASNDLVELGRIPVCVVSAGIKSILDIGRSLEYLETEGVLVMGYKTQDFPAFFSPKSGFKCYLGESDEAIAATVRTQLDVLGMQRGLLVGVPNAVADPAQVALAEQKTEEALAEAKARGVSGKAVTPFLLSRIAELTNSDSLALNIALIQNNARAAARIAVAYSQLD